MYPPPPESKPIFVAILDLLGFTRRLIDDDNVPIPGGLKDLYEKLFLFLHAIDWTTKVDHYELGSDENIRHVSGRINHFVASDTVLLWASDEEALYFVNVVAELVNKALLYGVPLRGAISYGHCIIDKKKCHPTWFADR